MSKFGVVHPVGLVEPERDVHQPAAQHRDERHALGEELGQRTEIEGPGRVGRVEDADTPPIWAVELAVSRARKAASRPVSCCIAPLIASGERRGSWPATIGHRRSRHQATSSWGVWPTPGRKTATPLGDARRRPPGRPDRDESVGFTVDQDRRCRDRVHRRPVGGPAGPEGDEGPRRESSATGSSPGTDDALSASAVEAASTSSRARLADRRSRPDHPLDAPAGRSWRGHESERHLAHEGRE